MSNEQHCTCSELEEADVPGSQLSKSPASAKKTELQFWLKCRGLKFRSVDTKAVLVNRVQENMRSGVKHKIIDPDPTQCYAKLKKMRCSVCRPATSDADKDEHCTFSDNFSNKSISWDKSAKIIPNEYSYINLRNHVEQTGKRTSGVTYIEKTLQKGYKFFYENYIHNVQSAKYRNQCLVKCLCYRSQRRNETPHNVKLSLNLDGSVQKAKCSCVAGIIGHCNHVVGLLFLLNHCKCMDLSEFPSQGTCTQNPQVWHRPRTSGLHSEPVMGYCVIKPQYEKTTKGITSTLYEARSCSVRDNAGLETLLTEMKSINPTFGICSLDTDDNNYVKTKMGSLVPLGSTLAHQISPVEGNFKVNFENMHVNSNRDINMSEEFPSLPKMTVNILPLELRGKLEEIDFIKVSDCQSVEIEKATVDQSLSKTWYNERQKRITASIFGQIMKRKDLTVEFAKTLMAKKDLSKVPAIKYGKENEAMALKKYLEYMDNSGEQIKFFKSGLVINPNFPWLGASPDGKIIDNKTGYGLLEIKCPYSFRDISPQAACENHGFFCEVTQSGHFQLKKSHEYYTQVQGQMGVCGLDWCDFVVYTRKGLLIIKIEKNEVFWEEMLNKLSQFYLQCFYPALSNSDSICNT